MSDIDRTRVLLLSPCFGEYGGIEAFVFAIAEMADRDPRLDVRICFKRVKHFTLGETLQRYCMDRGVTFCDRMSAGLWRQIAWADVVHAQNASPDVALMCTLQRTPLLLTIHDFLPGTPWLRRLSWRASARCATRRWYDSTAVWRTWEPAAGRSGSARISPVSRLPNAWVAPSARNGFVFVGRLVTSKGVATLLDAYAASGLDDENTPLTIIGDGPLRAALEHRAAQNRLRHVRFLGFVDERRRADAVASARWLVAPSHEHEGFGLVAIEARHAGVPCIVTRHGGLPEAGGADALMCEPLDVAGLRDALLAGARMAEDDYLTRADRTRRTLADQLVGPAFYGDAYQELRRAGR